MFSNISSRSREINIKKLTRYERTILNLLNVHGRLNRAEVAELTGFSLTKIANVICSLNNKDLIQKTEGHSSGGRKPVVLEIKDDACFAMGIEISIQDIKVVIININGDILTSVKHHEPLRKKRKITLEDIIELSNKALKSINLTWNNISVLGVGTAGIIDERNGKILLLPNAPNLENLKIVQALREKTGVKNIHMTDYVRSMAVSESRYGKGKEFDNFILFNICADLGAGIIINKKLISGSMGIVGEIGHIYVGESRELCVCGNYGCLESVASGSALVNRAKDAISKGVFTSMSDLKLKNDSIQIDDIIEAAKQGDKLAVNLIEETTKYLSIGVSTLMNLLDPQAIILAGALITKAGDLLIKPLVTETEAKTLPWIRKHINLFPSELGEYISARGAARLAIDRSFDVIF